MKPWRGACSLAVVLVVTSTQAARAAGTPPIVRVYVAGSPEAVSGTRDAVQELCAHSNVAVVVRDAAGADEALLSTSHAPGLAEAYVDLRPGTAPRVVVVDAETRQDLERRSLPDDASLEISIETVAHVVCAAVESSLAARAAPTVVAPAGDALDKPRVEHGSRAQRADASWESRASLFASAANFGAGFRPGAGASLGASRGHAPLRLGAFLSFFGYPAADVESAGGLASFGLLGARLMPAVEWQASPGVTVFAGIGGGADWIRIAAERPPPGTLVRQAGTSVDAMASGMFGVRLRVSNGVAALLALDADVDLSRRHYVIQTPGGSRSFFEPSPLRPIALAGLSFSLGEAGTPHRLPREALQ